MTPSRERVAQGISTRSGGQPVTPSIERSVQSLPVHRSHIPPSWEEIEDPGAFFDSINEESVPYIFLCIVVFNGSFFFPDA